MVRRFSTFVRAAAPLLAALAAHLAIALALVSRVVAPTGAKALTQAVQPAHEDRGDLSLDVTTEVAPPAASSSPEGAAGASAPSRRFQAAARAGIESAAAPGGVARAVIGASGEGERSPVLDPSEGGAGAAWFRPSAVVDLRLNASAGTSASVGAGSGADRPQEQAPPAATTGGLAEGLDAADFARGMGRGGPVLAAVHEAARSADAPTFGKATFSVVIGEDGNVDVDVTAASADSKAWERLRPAIVTALFGKPIRVAPRTKGLRVVVQVEASERFPGGGEPTPVSKQGVAIVSSAGKITETKDELKIELPRVGLTYRSRNCGGGILIGPGGATAGAGCQTGVAMRVVEARIVREERL